MFVGEGGLRCLVKTSGENYLPLLIYAMLIYEPRTTSSKLNWLNRLFLGSPTVDLFLYLIYSVTLFCSLQLMNCQEKAALMEGKKQEVQVLKV